MSRQRVVHQGKGYQSRGNTPRTTNAITCKPVPRFSCVRLTIKGMFKHILCPIDGSDASLKALDVAVRLTVDQGAQLTLCTVVDTSKALVEAFPARALIPEAIRALDDDAAKLLADAAAHIKPTTSAQVITIHGDPVESIAHSATELGCDVIVMGTHGRGGLRRALLGSVAEGALRHAAVPVIVVRSPSEVPQLLAQHEEHATRA